MFDLGSGTTVEKVHELDLNGFKLDQLIPGLNGRREQRQNDWSKRSITQDGYALLSVHSWLVRHQGMVVLVDTGAGNDKARPQQPVLDLLQTNFMQRLAGAEVSPERVDYVLHTHIHSDHVGWNTRLANGEWISTFPNATHICSRIEWEYGEASADGDEGRVASIRDKAGLGEPTRIPLSGTFDDSMRPLMRSGQVDLIEVNGEPVLPGIRFIPTPGHSIDHAAIELATDERLAIFGRDAMHHTVELYDTDLVSIFCEFPEVTRRSRRALLARSAASGALYLSAHFPFSSAGVVTRVGDVFEWRYEPMYGESTT